MGRTGGTASSDCEVRAWICALALVSAPVAARAAPQDVTSPGPDKVAVTIYRDGQVSTRDLMSGGGPDGLALVRETRTIDLPGGVARVRFSNVADRIIPQSAAIDGLPPGAIERNFDYDLMSPGSLLEKSVGAAVRLIRTNPRTGAERELSATIRAAPDGVMLEIDGAAEALHCAGLPERLVLDRAPAALTATPTLSALIETPKAGRYQVRLSYLALGLVWSADYIARLAPDERTADLIGWVTLANRSDTTFANAPTEVVAGALSRVDDDNSPTPTARSTSPHCWPISSGRMQPPRLSPPLPAPEPIPVVISAQRREEDLQSIPVTTSAFSQIAPRDIGDYKLYQLPEPTRVAARQIKQVQFLNRSAVPFEWLYRYRILPRDLVRNPSLFVKRRAATKIIRMRNDAAHRLGLPLPAGRAAVYERSADGAPTYAGGDKSNDVPIGLPWEVELGRTNDVSVRARIVDDVRPRKDERRVTIELAIANDKSIAAAFELAQLPDAYARIVAESRPHALREGLFIWPFKLPRGARATFRYTIDFRA